MSDTNTKPFEIRASLLHLAKDLLSEDAHMQSQAANERREPFKEWPRYTTEQVIAEAEKLYAFVSKR